MIESRAQRASASFDSFFSFLLSFTKISLALYIPFRSHSYVHISSVSLADFFFHFFLIFNFSSLPASPPVYASSSCVPALCLALVCFFFRELRYRIIINGNGKKSKQQREKASTRERRNIKRSGAEKRDVEKESQRRSFVIESILCIESSSSQIIGGKKGAYSKRTTATQHWLCVYLKYKIKFHISIATRAHAITINNDIS